MDFRWSTLWFIEVRLKSPDFWISISGRCIRLLLKLDNHWNFHRIVAAVSVLHVLHLWCVDSCDIFEMNLRFVLLSGSDLIVVYWTLKFCLEVGVTFEAGRSERIYDEFVEKAKVRALKRIVGDPFKKGVEQGPQIDEEQFSKILRYIKSGINSGATLVTGGDRIGNKGYYIQATIFSDVQDEMKIAQDEIFGPVQSILKFRQAVALEHPNDIDAAAESILVEILPSIATSHESSFALQDANEVVRVSTSGNASFVLWLMSKNFMERLWDARTLTLLKTYVTECPVNACAISPLLDHVVIGGGQEAVHVTTTDRRAGKFEAKFFHKNLQEKIGGVKGHFGPINALAFNPDGRRHAKFQLC
ncbi:hypothetical protein ZIOFF_012809 [Zingiber officinale]|uniref:Aldehyde dehydrogenase domain-containing protein n=1 Tax=Zingiber officinale TaxID=94328 RepID=A0A8J5LU82_ZINOF|nr:hypothetical protein ZIOFF_012809 [Zingiber officinale]